MYRAAYKSTEYQVYRTAYNSTVQLFRTGLVQYSCSEPVITDLREADPVRVMRDPREDTRETSLENGKMYSIVQEKIATKTIAKFQAIFFPKCLFSAILP